MPVAEYTIEVEKRYIESEMLHAKEQLEYFTAQNRTVNSLLILKWSLAILAVWKPIVTKSLLVIA